MFTVFDYSSDSLKIKYLHSVEIGYFALGAVCRRFKSYLPYHLYRGVAQLVAQRNSSPFSLILASLKKPRLLTIC